MAWLKWVAHDFVGATTFYTLTLLEGLQFSFRHGSSIMRRISQCIPYSFLMEANRLATGQIPHD
jgi:hypothetical protein